MSFSREQSLIIAVGGLILFIGFTMLTFTILGVFNIIEIETLLHFHLLEEALVAVGILDLITGVLLLFPQIGKGRHIVRKKPLTTAHTRASLRVFISARRRVIGYLEVGIGFTMVVFAVLFFINVIKIENLIKLPLDYFPLFKFVLLIFGFIFTVNGFFLIDKARAVHKAQSHSR